MLPYWLLFAFFATGAFYEGAKRGPVPAGPMLAISVAFVALMIGLRFEVGADWVSYEFMYHYAGRASLTRLLGYADPGYVMLNWLAQQAGAGLWAVNLVCGAIFAWGLFRFAKAQMNPWLAVLAAVPYLIMVVAMGYTRQAVAIGILMMGLAAYGRTGSVARFAFYVAAAALFHKTAVVALPLVALGTRRNSLINILVAAAAGYLLYDLFLSDSVDAFMENYIRRGYSSQGAAIRIVMNMVPALIFLFYSKRLNFPPDQRQMWRNFSVAALILLVLLLTTPSSTAVDRISLYIIPLQLAVLARVPASLTSRLLGYALVALYCFAVQFTWLNFAVHSKYWVPYQLYPVFDGGSR